MAVHIHYIDDDWTMQQELLDFISIEGSHSGSTLAEYICNLLEFYDIEDRLSNIMADNASNMDTLVQNISDRLGRTIYRSRCISHILNLVVQAILGKGGSCPLFFCSESESLSDSEPEEEVIVGLGKSVTNVEEEDIELNVGIGQAITTLREIVKCKELNSLLSC
jgi:hypothetical protein